MKKLNDHTSVILATFILGAVLVIVFNDWLFANLASEAGEQLSTSIRNYALIIGGFLGLLFAFQRLQIAERGQVTERFSKAVEHIGDKENVSVRIGGLYALEKIALDSEKERATIQKVIASFIRRPPYLDKSKTTISSNLNDCPDIHIAIKIFRDLNNSSDSYPDLSNARLEYLDLSRLDLSKLNFTGASFKGSSLKYANLNKSNFVTSDFEKSDLSNVSVHSTNFMNTDFTKSILFQSTIKDCCLSFSKFEEAEIESTSIRNSALSYCDFSKCSFGSNDIDNCNLTGSIFPNDASCDNLRLASNWALEGQTSQLPMSTKLVIYPFDPNLMLARNPPQVPK